MDNIQYLYYDEIGQLWQIVRTDEIELEMFRDLDVYDANLLDVIDVCFDDDYDVNELN